MLIGTLVVSASLLTMLITQLPPSLKLEQDALDLAVRAAITNTERVRTIITKRLWRMELECKELHRAASQQNLLTITSVMKWVGDVVGHDVSAGFTTITSLLCSFSLSFE